MEKTFSKWKVNSRSNGLQIIHNEEELHVTNGQLNTYTHAYHSTKCFTLKFS